MRPAVFVVIPGSTPTEGGIAESGNLLTKDSHGGQSLRTPRVPCEGETVSPLFPRARLPAFAVFLNNPEKGH